MSVSRDRKIRAIIKTYMMDSLDFLSLYNGLDIDKEHDIYSKTGIKIDEVTKVEWFFGLFDTLEDYINKNYLRDEDKIIINNIFPTIGTIFTYGDFEQVDVSIELLKLTHLINKKLDKLIDKNYYDYKELQNRLVELAIANKHNLMYLYDGYNFDFINYILFEEKNSEISYEMLEDYPSLVSVYIDGEYLFNRVIDEYLKSLKYTIIDSYRDMNDYEYYSELINIMLNNQELHISSKNKKELLKKINNYKDMLTNCNCKKIEVYKADIDELIDHIELISDININNLIKKFDIEMDFDPTINQEYYSLRRPEDQIDNYDYNVLSNTCVITIDVDRLGIYDDALSIEEEKDGNLKLGVHIADPTNYVIPGGLVDKKARERAFSLLFGKSMFPKGLLNNYLSLKEGVPRYANSFYFTIDKNGNVIKDEYCKTLLMVNKNLTTNEVNEILERGASNEYLDTTIKNLNNCKNRLARYFDFDPKYEQVKGEEMDIANTRIEGKDSASTIVRYAMALTNSRIASFAHQNNYPFIYRNYNENGDGLGEYSTTSRGHDGLNLKDYSHITCPLRRYPDFANAVALNHWLFNESSKEELYDLDMELKYIAYSVNSKQRKFKNLVKDYNNKKVGD